LCCCTQEYETAPSSYKGKFNILSLYHSLLQMMGPAQIAGWLGHSCAQDAAALKRICQQADTPSLHKVVAMRARSIMLMFNRDTEKSLRLNFKAQKLAAGMSSAQRAETVLLLPEGSFRENPFWNEVTVDECLDDVIRFCKRDQDIMQRNQMASAMLYVQQHEEALGMQAADPAADAQFHEVVCITGTRCVTCGRSADETPLHRCATCGFVHYCSRDCQRADWKKRNKQECRPPRDFRAGDLVLMDGSKAGLGEVNGELLGKDEARGEGHWLVNRWMADEVTVSRHESTFERDSRIVRLPERQWRLQQADIAKLRADRAAAAAAASAGVQADATWV
jgi:MYND finger